GDSMRVGTITDERMKEASGLVASRRFPDVYWIHNDGEKGLLCAMKRDGSLIGCTKIDAELKDWEDIAIDDDGNLYVADTGNNNFERKSVVVYRVREPDPATLRISKPDEINFTDRWKIDFPGEPADIESMFVWKGFGYFVSKVKNHGNAKVYRFD